jgi:CRISPR-associated protein Csb1
MSTTTLLTDLADEPRLTVEAELRPVQGSRFQATGFPDLGPARYQRPDGTEMLLVESAQSMANRLEAVCWDDARGDLAGALAGMPYVRVKSADGAAVTNSILEAHRINSPYILEGQDRSFVDLLKEKAGGLDWGPVDWARLADMVFSYDPNSILHGVFLAKKELARGRLRLTRVLSSFVEAEGVAEAESGGVKNDRVDPSGSTSEGFGNVPFHRSEFTAKRITAYFSLDLALLRSYRLPEPAAQFLAALALWKVEKFLSGPTRYRTACDLEPVGLALVTRPATLPLVPLSDLEDEMRASISACRDRGLFADPPVTTVVWRAKKSS